jgi:UPF0716 family protein affecting phage T7 exclusion
MLCNNESNVFFAAYLLLIPGVLMLAVVLTIVLPVVNTRCLGVLSCVFNTYLTLGKFFSSSYYNIEKPECKLANRLSPSPVYKNANVTVDVNTAFECASKCPL